MGNFLNFFYFLAIVNPDKASGSDDCEDLYKKYYDRILSYVLNRSDLQTDNPDELIFDILFYACKQIKADKYDPTRAPLGAFIIGIAKNRILEYKRRNAKESKRGYLSVQIDENTIQIIEQWKDSTYAENKKLRAKLEKCMKKLPVKYQIILTLYWYEECSTKEIGEMLGLTQQQVIDRHRQAKNLIRKRCGKLLYGL